MDVFYGRVFEEIAEETQVDINEVESALRHLHDWTRETLQNLTVTRILWRKCFSFNRIENKVDIYLKYCEKEKKENPNSKKWAEEVQNIKALKKLL